MVKSPVQSTAKRKLRVLWFTTSPSLGRAHLDDQATSGTSWIEALEYLFMQDPHIDLAIAFTWRCDSISSFRMDGHPTLYYTIPRRPQNKWTRAIRRVMSLPEDSQKIADDCSTIAQDFQPDIVTFFGTETPYPLSIPNLKCPHLIWFQGNLTVYQKKWHIGISKLESLMGGSLDSLLQGHSDLHYFLLYRHYVIREKKIFKLSQNFIGRTSWDRRLVSIMAPQAQYYHCEEAMRPAFFRTVWDKPRDEKRITILSTFRDNLFKGLETAMEAFMLLNTVVEGILEWKIVGISADSNYAKISQRSAEFQGDENFKLVGFKSAEELAAELVEADIFVHPSHIDNSPNSLCEAMLIGVPCISTNVGGIPSLVEDGIDGLLVQDGDPYAMAGSILSLIKDPTWAKKLGARARQRGLKRNSGVEIKNNLLTIYNEIIDRSAQTDVSNNSSL